WTISLWGSATKHATRVIDGTLFAQNRVYWSNISGGIGAWMELTIFLILLYFGWGVESYSWAYITSILCSVLGIGIAFYAGPWRPQLRARNFDISMLKELFSFSLKLFVLGAVAQVVFLSQSLIATKLFGLTAAGSYNVCMRLLQLGRQVIARLHDAHIPGWQKLFLDGQMAELLGRWRYHFKFVVGSTLFGAITITCWNSLFVNHWASPALNIGPAFDFLSGAFLLANIWTGAMMAPLIFKMELKIRTYMALIQLVMTLLLCFSFSKYFGLKGVLLGALIANLITVFWFNSWKGAQILGEKWNQIWDRILRPNTALLAAMACCGIISLFGNFETSYSLTIWGFSAIAYILIHRDYLIEFVYKQSAS
ncbi:MAG: oligosaccharide flippase family protein, partial [bacterium]